MPEVELSAGTIEYEDSGPPSAGAGDHATIVLLHGLLMDGSLWRKVEPELSGRHRVICPTLPLGAHRIPMRADADLALPAMVRLLAEFLEALDLRDVVLVTNDWGGPLLLVDLGRAERVGRLVITPSEAFDNFPPGRPGQLAALAGRSGPLGIQMAMQPMRFRALRRLPLLFGAMSKRPVPDAILDAWFGPVLHNPAIRRDLAKYAGGPLDRAWTTAATERLAEFDRPALVAWAPEDRLMPREHGSRLAALLPQGRLVEIADSYTLVPEDQPDVLLDHLRDFLAETTGT